MLESSWSGRGLLSNFISDYHHEGKADTGEHRQVFGNQKPTSIYSSFVSSISAQRRREKEQIIDLRRRHCRILQLYSSRTGSPWNEARLYLIAWIFHEFEYCISNTYYTIRYCIWNIEVFYILYSQFPDGYIALLFSVIDISTPHILNIFNEYWKLNIAGAAHFCILPARHLHDPLLHLCRDQPQRSAHWGSKPGVG